MKILLVGGFLGSGKTSFILKLAHHMIDDLGIQNIVILENEIGEISLDDKVLEASGYSVKGLFAGCVCCTLAGELPGTIRSIEHDINPEWLIMEATGVAFPYNIKENVSECLGYECRIVTLADAQRWNRLVRAMENLFAYQMKDADVVLVNKADLVDEETLAQVLESVKNLSGCEEVKAVSANGAIESALLDRIIAEEA